MVPIVVFILGVLVSHNGAAAAACTTNSQCTGFGELCITYYNYAKGQKCATSKKCTGTLGPVCSCTGGYQCRAKKCPSDPFECLLLENTATRCGLFTCPFLNVCAYEATGTNCAIGTCPCYGRYRRKCVFNPDAYFACGLDTIPIVSSTGVVTCNGCQSATTVLTGP
ncbi:uncharacterized protein LOC144148431 [Haemaphysalis longicornis]